MPGKSAGSDEKIFNKAVVPPVEAPTAMILLLKRLRFSKLRDVVWEGGVC